MGLAFGIPVALMACFGGSARRVWDIMNRVPHHATAEELCAMGEEWTAGLAPRLVRLLLAQRQRQDAADQGSIEPDAASHGAVRSASPPACFFLFLGRAMVPLAYAYAFDSNATRNLTALIVGALATGTADAFTRNTFDCGEYWARTAALGMSAGAAAFLLLVPASWRPPPECSQGRARGACGSSCSPSAFVSGFTFDAVYDRLEQAESPAPQPPVPQPPAHQGMTSSPPWCQPRREVYARKPACPCFQITPLLRVIASRRPHGQPHELSPAT